LDEILREDQAEIVCNECNAVICNLPSAELRQTLTEMELSLDVASVKCAHCGAVKVAPGFSKLLAFTRERCGAVTKVGDDPMAERLLG
jgi:hypothetical protein